MEVADEPGDGASIREHFEELTDPRRREPTYPLIEMVTMALCAVICGADDFVAIAKFARTKKEWFAQFLDLSRRSSETDPAATSE